MAHVESYTKKDIKRIIKEHDRTANSYKNDVDTKRTHLNWTYQDANADEILLAINSRCMDITNGKKLQEQTNLMCEWCITYPFTECIEKECVINDKTKTYNEPKEWNHCRMYFDEVYEFVRERYGSENVMCAYVHMDETTPQMHICFVPEATSRKTGNRTVSSASLLTRKELKIFHQKLQEHMDNVFGKNDYILNGRTKGGYSTEELKERTKNEKTFERKMKLVNKAYSRLQEGLESVDAIKASYNAVEPPRFVNEGDYRTFLHNYKKNGKTLLEVFDEEQERKQQIRNQHARERIRGVARVINVLRETEDFVNEDDFEY